MISKNQFRKFFKQAIQSTIFWNISNYFMKGIGREMSTSDWSLLGENVSIGAV